MAKVKDPYRDGRWDISKEYTGKPTIQFVVRFCGDKFLGSFDTEEKAEVFRREEIDKYLEKISYKPYVVRLTDDVKARLRETGVLPPVG